MIFRYPLTDSQYARFQHSTNDAEIRAICDRAGVKVTDEQIVNNIETWYFKGRCSGTMVLVKSTNGWYCMVNVHSKPWWLPWFVLDWGFKEALK